MSQNQRGSITTNILLALMLVAIGVLVFLLTRRDSDHVGQTRGLDAVPVVQRGVTGFQDGLQNPNAASKQPLDEYGAGTESIEVFNRDINNDKIPDRITRRRIENGTAHFYYDYKVELNNGKYYTNITPSTLRTTEGAECALTKLQFIFEPEFQIIKISRPWQESWSTPTMARKTVYTLKDNVMHTGPTTNLRVVCDVAELF